MTSPAIISGQVLTDDDTTLAAGPTITASGSANTKGSYTELIAATAYNSHGIILTPNVGSTNADFLADVAIGAGGSEQILIANFPFSEVAIFSSDPVYLPIFIPAGTRIAARCQSTTGGATMRLSVNLVSGGALIGTSLMRAVTYGANTTDSGGVSVDPGATANTVGSFVEITSATTAPVKFLVVSIGNQVNTARTTASWKIEVAIGAAASEQVIASRLQAVTTTNHKPRPQYHYFPLDVPVGERLSARAMCSINDATDRLVDIIFIGVC